jgi:hypothetical protein
MLLNQLLALHDEQRQIVGSVLRDDLDLGHLGSREACPGQPNRPRQHRRRACSSHVSHLGVCERIPGATVPAAAASMQASESRQAMPGARAELYVSGSTESPRDTLAEKWISPRMQSR